MLSPLCNGRKAERPGEMGRQIASSSKNMCKYTASYLMWQKTFANSPLCSFIPWDSHGKTSAKGKKWQQLPQEHNSVQGLQQAEVSWQHQSSWPSHTAQYYTEWASWSGTNEADSPDLVLLLPPVLSAWEQWHVQGSPVTRSQKHTGFFRAVSCWNTSCHPGLVRKIYQTSEKWRERWWLPRQKHGEEEIEVPNAEGTTLLQCDLNSWKKHKHK